MWLITHCRHTPYLESSIQAWSPDTNFQFESHFSGVIAASASFAAATRFSKFSRICDFAVGGGWFIDGSHTSLSVVSVWTAQPPAVSATCPASLPSAIDLSCGFQ